MNRLIDLETTSGVDLKEAGVLNYVKHPDFKILVSSIKYLNHPVLNRYTDTIIAHNAEFERACLEKTEDLKDTTFICTSALSRFLGGPSSLEDCANYWELSEGKYIHGKSLIKYFQKYDSSDENYES